MSNFDATQERYFFHNLDTIYRRRKEIIADAEIKKQEELDSILWRLHAQCLQLTGHNFVGNQCTACGLKKTA